MALSDSVTLLSIFIGSGGLLSGLAILTRLRPEKDKVIVESAHGAVIVAKEAMDRVVQENDRLRKENADLRHDCDQWEKRHDELERLYAEKLSALEGIIAAIDDRQNPVVVLNPAVEHIEGPPLLPRNEETKNGND